jgi:hypothetical protein
VVVDSVEVADLAAATSEAAAQAEAGKVHCFCIFFYAGISMEPPDFSAAKRIEWPIFRAVRPSAKMPTDSQRFRKKDDRV